jgi:hypothetical protein
MRLTMAVVMAAALAAGVLVSADDHKKQGHKCPLEKIMCPLAGDCEGQCRAICDRGGEGLAAVHANVAASVKASTKKDASACVAGTCKAEGCKDCAQLNEKVFGPAVKDRVNARFGEMSKTVEHTVKDASGKETKVKCTFLTGKLCPECVNIMTKAALASLAELEKTNTK